MRSTHRTFLVSMALFWLVFGLGTTFYPQMMQLFMTPEGIAGSTPFANHIWLHDGIDILSVCVLLFALSRLPVTPMTLRLAATVGLLPAVAIVYTLIATPYWRPVFILPGLACLAFAVWGFVLSQTVPVSTQTDR